MRLGICPSHEADNLPCVVVCLEAVLAVETFVPLSEQEGRKERTCAQVASPPAAAPPVGAKRCRRVPLAPCFSDHAPVCAFGVKQETFLGVSFMAFRSECLGVDKVHAAIH